MVKRTAMIPLTFDYVEANGLRFHYAAQGDDRDGKAPLVLLLHGFPAFWYSWRAQLPVLASAGHRAVAVDMRGYNKTDKPRGVAAYARKHLVADVRALVRSFGREKAIVVGHDWGGGVAWATAMDAPEVVEKLIILNSPHPMAFVRQLRTFDQLKKSWYMLAFQAPIAAEAWVRRNDYAFVAHALRVNAKEGTFSDADVQMYKDAMAMPGALTGSLGYYRAMFHGGLPREKTVPKVTAPTLVLWGDRDFALGVGLTKGLDAWVTNLELQYLRGAGHWIQNERPDEVNQAILRFLGARES